MSVAVRISSRQAAAAALRRAAFVVIQRSGHVVMCEPNVSPNRWRNDPAYTEWTTPYGIKAYIHQDKFAEFTGQYDKEALP